MSKTIASDRMERLTNSLLGRLAEADGPRSVADLRAEGVEASQPVIRKALEALVRLGHVTRASERRRPSWSAGRIWTSSYRTTVYSVAEGGSP